MTRRCHICSQNTWSLEAGCLTCKARRRSERRVAFLVGALVVSFLVAFAAMQLWAVDWDVKCWVSDKCRKVP